MGKLTESEISLIKIEAMIESLVKIECQIWATITNRRYDDLSEVVWQDIHTSIETALLHRSQKLNDLGDTNN